MKVKKFIECPTVGCPSQISFDEGDQDYRCNRCDMTLKPVVTPNVEEEMKETGDTVPFREE